MLPWLLVASALIFTQATSVAEQEDPDYYAVLQLEKGDESSEKEITRQYRALSKKYHPDHNSSDEAKEMYQKVLRANEVLSDKRKRKIYDIKGEDGVKQMEMREKGQGSNMFDVFESIFGGSVRDNSKGQTVQIAVQIALEDVYNGKTHQVTLKKQKLCKSCRGTGAASKADFHVCSTCKGEGIILKQMNLGGMFIQQVQQQCPSCDGRGKTIKKKCASCKGVGVMSGDHTLELEIERGAPENTTLNFEMEGDQFPDQIPGDLIFVLRTGPHETFTRDGENLKMNLKITLLEALTGFRKEVAHMDGHVVVIESAEITPHGAIITVSGEGMPKHNIPSEKGDLQVQILVSFPTQLTDEAKQTLKKVLTTVV
ncbi:chaperone DNAJ protein [Perkinsela sp. CCAP 1560/4]|nr:chaperone DNAJ protein [Perkinsela sp. CCAP 1560/4]|eukprot:KNH05623.1 chaperone DNAJ protein [Perkinsela sp. CCAP 1560/4]